jgi:multidrug efflux pump subunit AcrB
MLVDDAIIVAEQYYQNIEKGMPSFDAAREAAYMTIKPVTATIITTMIAFASLFFMGGIMGKFIWPIPAMVILCLFASWLECFFILPNHLADFGKSKGYSNIFRKIKEIKPSLGYLIAGLCLIPVFAAKKMEMGPALFISLALALIFFVNATKNLATDGKPWYNRFLVVYEAALKLALKNSFIVIFLFLGALIVSGIRAKSMPFELFPGDDVRVLTVNLKGQVGSPLNTTDKVIKELETMILTKLDKTELNQIRTWVGQQFGGNNNIRTGTHYGAITVYLTPPDERERPTDAIVKFLTEQAKPIIGNYEIQIDKQQGGPPRGKAVDIELNSASLKDLKKASKEVLAKLAEVKGVVAPAIDFEEGKKQFVVNVNDSEARRLGLSTQQVAFEIRRALAGDGVTEIRESEDDIEIVIMLDKESRKDLDSISKLFVLNSTGQRINLKKLVEFSTEPGAFIIRRKDGKRTFSVQAELNKRENTPVGVAQAIRPEVNKIIKSYPGMTFQLGGENEDTQESLVRLLKAGALSLFGIFFVLVAIFRSLAQPLIVMSAIPLGMIGVIITFNLSLTLNKIGDFLLPSTIGFLALMGMVGLVGVVVNDSIVLVNTINRKIGEKTHELIDSIRLASLTRFRAVLLTTITTVCGLLPIALDKGGDPFLKPMAWSFAGGLFFSTAVTLVFIPCAFHAYKKMCGWRIFSWMVPEETTS